MNFWCLKMLPKDILKLSNFYAFVLVFEIVLKLIALNAIYQLNGEVQSIKFFQLFVTLNAFISSTLFIRNLEGETHLHEGKSFIDGSECSFQVC